MMATMKFSSAATADYVNVLLILQDAIKTASENNLQLATERIATALAASVIVSRKDALREAQDDLGAQAEEMRYADLLLKSYVANDAGATGMARHVLETLDKPGVLPAID